MCRWCEINDDIWLIAHKFLKEVMNLELIRRFKLYGPFILLLTAAIAVACLFTAGSQAQAEEPEPLFYVENVFGAEGRQIEVPIKYRDISRMVGVEFILAYDPEILEPVDVIAGSTLPQDASFEYNLDHSSNSIKIVAAWSGGGDSYPPPEGEFCRVVFEMLQGGPAGAPAEAPLSISGLVVGVIETVGGGDTVVELDTCSTGDGTADVYEVVYGDVNSDTNVDVYDAIMVFNIHMGYTSPTPYQMLAGAVIDGTSVTVDEAILIFNRHMGYYTDPFPIELIDG